MVRVRITKPDGSVCAEYEHLADTTTLEDVLGIFAAQNELQPQVIQLVHNARRFDPLHNAADGKVTLNELCTNVANSSATQQLITLQAVFTNANLTGGTVNTNQASSTSTTVRSGGTVQVTSTPHSTQPAKVKETKPLINNLFQLMQKRGILTSTTSAAGGGAGNNTSTSTTSNTTVNNTAKHNLFAPGAVHNMNEEFLDENSVEVQQRLLKAIQQHNIDQNFMEAMEQIPQAYVRVPMLYITCTINHVPLKAFIDTGAQNSIMSLQIAQKCNLTRLIDRRMSGTAIGVGQAKIIGRIHMTLVQIDQLQVPCTFMVLQNKQSNIGLIIGLDQMRRHCMIVDLKQNALRIGQANVYFLPQSQLPPALQYSQLNEGKDKGTESKVEGKEDANNAVAIESHNNKQNSKTINVNDNIVRESAKSTNVNNNNNNNKNNTVIQEKQRPSQADAKKVQTTPEESRNEHIFTTFTNALSQSNRTKLHSFMAFTGITDVKLAQELLEASAWDVDHAAALFFNDDE